jgi:uncharacterized membrane protein
MADRDHIRNPVEWTTDQIKTAGLAVGHTGHALREHGELRDGVLPAIHHISVHDLRDVLARGIDDFMAYRTDVMFLCIIYPLAGLVLAVSAFNYDFAPLLFPLVSGFALLGPVAAVGLYEMSRRREQGKEASWADALGVVATPAFGEIVVLGLILIGIFLLWLVTAYTIYKVTMGNEGVVSFSAFYHDVFTTAEGRALMVVGIGVGFLFAVLVLMISVVSFPMLLDRDVGLYTAVATSVQAVLVNPIPMAVWGLIVAGALVLGSLPVLLGLIIVMPVLGHATWHLYRKVVSR